MSGELSRRDVLRSAAAGGLAAAAGSLVPASSLLGDEGASPAGATTVGAAPGAGPATIVDGRVIQPQRELPLLRKTGVLVVGGGPAGAAAALAARRTGADVTLVERYGHLGGLCTGGLVLLVYPMFSQTRQPVVRGIGEEMLVRLDRFGRSIINHAPGRNPTVDAEAFKFVLADMVAESGMHPYLHCWSVEAIVDGGGVVRGAVVESKSGRQAILADVVVDASGDGDIYAAAGAAFEKVKYDIGLVCRLGNVDRVDRSKLTGDAKPPGLGAATPVPGVTWLNMRGPAADGLDVAELTRLEINHRRHIWNRVEQIRKLPGHEQVYLVETAPQLGVRLTRLLAGVHRLTMADAQAGRTFDDVIAVGGVEGTMKKTWQLPYRCLLPAKLDGLLAAGRCVSSDFRLADIVRLIAVCFTTGHAAGTAAALCSADRCRPRDLDVGKLQKTLREQDAYLG